MNEEQQNVEYAVQWLKEKVALSERHIVPPSLDRVGLMDANLLTGLEVEKVEHNRVLMSYRVGARLSMRNEDGDAVLDEGAIAALVDVVGSTVAMTGGFTLSNLGVSSDINVTYCSAAPINTELHIEARLLKLDPEVLSASVELKNKATGQVVAQGRHTKSAVGTFWTQSPL